MKLNVRTFIFRIRSSELVLQDACQGSHVIFRRKLWSTPQKKIQIVAERKKDNRAGVGTVAGRNRILIRQGTMEEKNPYALARSHTQTRPRRRERASERASGAVHSQDTTGTTRRQKEVFEKSRSLALFSSRDDTKCRPIRRRLQGPLRSQFNATFDSHHHHQPPLSADVVDAAPHQDSERRTGRRRAARKRGEVSPKWGVAPRRAPGGGSKSCGSDFGSLARTDLKQKRTIEEKQPMPNLSSRHCFATTCF